MLPERPASMVTNTLDPQVCFAEQGLGIAYLPEIAVRRQLEQGSPVTVLDEYDRENMVFMSSGRRPPPVCQNQAVRRLCDEPPFPALNDVCCLN